MGIDALLQTLYGTPLAVWIRESEYAFPGIETVHVLAITLVVGSITVVDLRLLGVASRDRAVSRLSADVLPVTWTAFGFAAASGLLLFASNAPRYAVNSFFRVKLALLALAGLNMLAFQLLVARDLVRWDTAPAAPRAARIAAAVSLALWILVVAAGRWIGFTMLASP
jgi:hypothetical protein